jgi:hypothetical protein
VELAVFWMADVLNLSCLGLDYQSGGAANDNAADTKGRPMTLRQDHRIMISQLVNGEDHWTTVRLMDKSESADGRSVTGQWRHTDQSYNDKEIKFTSDHPEYLYWEFSQPNAHGGVLKIGSKMGRASHKEGEDTIFQVLITLYNVKRQAGGRFAVGGVLDEGAGKLTYNVDPHFEKGDITWTVVRYGG